MNKSYRNICIVLFFVLLCFYVIPVFAKDSITLETNFGLAYIDGDSSEWDVEEDFFIDMHQAWKLDKPLLSKMYVRYHCPSNTLNVLVLAVEDYPITTQPEEASQHWITIDGNQMVDEGDINNTELPLFKYVEVGFDGNPNHARGWEAAFTLGEGAFEMNETYQIKAHTLVWMDGEWQTSGMGHRRDIYIHIECILIPVELTTFSAQSMQESVLLSWATATETENLGFKIYRAENDEFTCITQNFIHGAGNSSSESLYSYEDKNVVAGKTYQYKLADVNYNGEITFHDPISITHSPIPEKINLYQNYPNPFNPTTSIRFDLKEAGFVSLKIYNTSGQLIRTLTRENYEIGKHIITWSGLDNNSNPVGSGTYLCVLKMNDFKVTRKIILMK